MRIPRGAVVTDWRRKPSWRASCRWLIWLCVDQTITPTPPQPPKCSAEKYFISSRFASAILYVRWSVSYVSPRDLVNVPGDQTTTQVQHMLSTSSPTERDPYHNIRILSGEQYGSSYPSAEEHKYLQALQLLELHLEGCA